MLQSSIALARSAGSCPEGIERTRVCLLHLHDGREVALFPVAAVLECCGLDDAIWALRAVPFGETRERDQVARTFAVECVAYAGSMLRNPAEADHLRRVLRMACLCAEGRMRPNIRRASGGCCVVGPRARTSRGRQGRPYSRDASVKPRGMRLPARCGLWSSLGVRLKRSGAGRPAVLADFSKQLGPERRLTSRCSRCGLL